MAEFGYYLDILAVSCDSFHSEVELQLSFCQNLLCQVNDKIGRHGAGGGEEHLTSLHRVREWCDAYGVLFKLNTVVNSHNWEEDMVEQISRLRPVRWKVGAKYNTASGTSVGVPVPGHRGGEHGSWSLEASGALPYH